MKKFLAMLCAFCLCFMWMTSALPVMAGGGSDSDQVEKTNSEDEDEEAKKKEEEERKRKEEEQKKKEEEERKRKEEEQKKKEEEERKRQEEQKKEEEERKRQEEQKKEEEEKKRQEEEQKKEEEEKKRQEEEQKKKEEEEKKRQEEEQKKKEEEEKKQAEETGEPTEEPTEEPTAEPTEEPTAEPTATPTPAPTPTPTPAPLKLQNLKASSGEAAPGSSMTFTLTVENAEKVVWSAKRSDGQSGGSGNVEGGSFSWKPHRSGVYTITVNASAGDMTASESCTVIVRDSKLKVSVKAATKYAMVGGEDLRYEVSCKGGCEPYSMSAVVKFKGKEIYKSNELAAKVVCDAKGYGENELTVVITDAAGDTAKAKAVILSATNETNDAPGLPKLSADMTFAERLVAVAKSQVGYHESKENFIIRDDGSVQGWSYYGGWYGMPYEEWCAMFVSYCLQRAGIDEGIMPQSANCNRWKGHLGARYIDDEDNYFPEAGDLIYFHHDRVSKDPNFPNHIGIVTDFDAEKGIVYTVEGNAGKAVSVRQYPHNSAVIVGYASMRYCMVRWDRVFKARLADEMTASLASLVEGMLPTGQEAPEEEADTSVEEVVVDEVPEEDDSDEDVPVELEADDEEVPEGDAPEEEGPEGDTPEQIEE